MYRAAQLCPSLKVTSVARGLDEDRLRSEACGGDLGFIGFANAHS